MATFHTVASLVAPKRGSSIPQMLRGCQRFRSPGPPDGALVGFTCTAARSGLRGASSKSSGSGSLAVLGKGVFLGSKGVRASSSRFQDDRASDV